MYTVDPHYSQISYLCICLPAKFVIPKSVLCHFCGQSQRGIKRQKISAATCKHMFSTEVKLVSSLPTCFSSQTINKCSFHNLLGVMFFTFCVFCWWLHCLKWPPSVVLKWWLVFLSARRLWCALWRKYTLDKLCSGWATVLLAWVQC